MTSTYTADNDRSILADASLDSDNWDDATWAAWFRAAARAHGERFDGDTKPANARTLLGALLQSARWAVALTKQGQAEEATEHVDAIERLVAAYRDALGIDAVLTRRIYVDGEGDPWIDHGIKDGVAYIVPLDPASPGNAYDAEGIRKNTGGLREIGRCA